MDGSSGSKANLNLNLSFDDESLSALEDMAAAQRCSMDELVTSILRKAIRGEQKARRSKSPSLHDAPLDAFLPDGADPFAPVGTGDSGLASSFAAVQTRMRFAGTPSILRDLE